jgi:hypothetical protein
MTDVTKRKSMSAQEAMGVTKVRYAETIECLDDNLTDAEYDAHLIQLARADDAARKAATDAHFPDFDEHAAGMCDPRHSLSRFHDGVVRIPAFFINLQNGSRP